MLEKGFNEIGKSKISELQLENVNSDFCDVIIKKENVNEINPFDLNVIVNNEGTTNDDTAENINRGKEDPMEGWTIPVGYRLLPEEFFKVDGIPPPLVSIKWLSLICDKSDDEESEEDSIPLMKLKSRLKKNQKRNKLKSNLPQGDKKKRKKTAQTNKKHSIINRKRGRPKKSVVETDSFSKDNNDFEDIQDETDECFWKSPSNSPDISVQIDIKSDCEKEEDSSDLTFKEHDYYKSFNNNLDNSIEEDKKNQLKKKKEKIIVQGIKIDDSKTSFPCVECGKTFSAASTLKNHLRIHNDTLLKCTECHKGFTTKYLLKCHMRIHSGDLFMCHKCGKGFITAELLKVHSRGHTGDRPFVCNICNKSFPSASNLSQHKQTHNLEKKFLCFQCGSSFSQKRCLDGHMLTHAEKNHICTVCGKLWARKSDLSEHMRVHTGIKPYCCSVCPQKFTQASSLKRHQIVHTEIKPIQCSTCNKMFKCQQYYKRHMKKHVKETNYPFIEVVKNI